MHKNVFLVIFISLTAAGGWSGGPSSFDVVMEHYEKEDEPDTDQKHD